MPEQCTRGDQKKAVEMVARALHHARNLAPLARVVKDIICHYNGFKQFNSTLHFQTPKGVYNVRPYGDGHNKYVGIEIVLRGRRLVALKIDKDKLQEPIL